MPNKGSKAADSLRKDWRSEANGGGRKPAQARGTFHLPAELLDEMRNAVVALSGPPHRLTMSKLAENAIRRELDHLQREGGGAPGKRFSQRAAEVTRGRPVR